MLTEVPKKPSLQSLDLLTQLAYRINLPTKTKRITTLAFGATPRQATLLSLDGYGRAKQ